MTNLTRRRIASACALLAAGLAVPFSAAAFASIPTGKSELTLDVDGTPIEIHTYKPERYAGGPLLLVLHGLGRNVTGYRDYAVGLADRHGFLVVAPLFDRERFPAWRYQWGGIVQPAGRVDRSALVVAPREEWTGRLLLGIVDRVRALEGAPARPYSIIGHSAGGQILSRVTGFMPLGAQRIVIANPGTYLAPSREAQFPDGFGAIPEPWSADETLRRYLAQPITLLLGTADVEHDTDLPSRESAVAQGANRYERGHNVYRAAQSLAQARGWTFNWKLVEVPGVGHSARRMLGSKEAAAALTSR